MPALSQPIWTLPPERHLPALQTGAQAHRCWRRDRFLASHPRCAAPAMCRHSKDVVGGPTKRRSNASYRKELPLCTTSMPADTNARRDALIKPAPVLLASAPVPPPTPTPTFLQALSSPTAATLTPGVGQRRKRDSDNQTRRDTDFHCSSLFFFA